MINKVSIVNNGMFETIFDLNTGKAVHKCLIDSEQDALSYLDSCGHPYELVSYSCY